ncbi:MAG: hypothetical protein WCC64_12475 [Aliidongia sp.]
MATLGGGADVRANRLTTLVSNSENEIITKKAEAAGLSVSAFPRDLALGSLADMRDEAALRQVDAMIDRMEGDLDSAIGELSATLARMDAR